MRIESLWRFPIKSMIGERLHETAVSMNGFPGDRLYAFRDRESGRIVTAKTPKRYPGLHRCRGGLLGEDSAERGLPAPLVELPDGTTAVGDAAAEAVSRLIGRDVELVTTAAAGTQIDMEYDDSLPDAVPPDVVSATTTETGEAHVLSFAFPGVVTGTLQDLAPLHILMTSSLRKLAAVAPDVHWDVRRFRPNILIDDDDEDDVDGFVEDRMMGHELHIGSVTARLTAPVPRCIMTTLEWEDRPREHAVLRAIADNNKQSFMGTGRWACLGAYAEIVRGGVVSEGDTVNLGERSAGSGATESGVGPIKDQIGR